MEEAYEERIVAGPVRGTQVRVWLNEEGVVIGSEYVDDKEEPIDRENCPCRWCAEYRKRSEL